MKSTGIDIFAIIDLGSLSKDGGHCRRLRRVNGWRDEHGPWGERTLCRVDLELALAGARVLHQHSGPRLVLDHEINAHLRHLGLVNADPCRQAVRVGAFVLLLHFKVEPDTRPSVDWRNQWCRYRHGSANQHGRRVCHIVVASSVAVERVECSDWRESIQDQANLLSLVETTEA
jgi:hypothetical protein